MILHREKWKVLPVSVPLLSSLECLACQLPGPIPTIIATVYRKTALPLTTDFSSALDSFGFHQFADFPAHTKGHTLDLICCSGLTPSNCTADELHIKDHFLLSFHVSLQLSISKPPRVISFHNVKDINLESLSSCIATQTPDSTSTPNDMVRQYNNGLQYILNSLAPIKSCSRSAPWFTTALRSMKSKNRQLERLFRKTGISIHKDMYLAQLSLYRDSISQAKSQYYSGLIFSNAGNSKTLFYVFNNIIQPPDYLPTHLYSRSGRAGPRLQPCLPPLC